MKKYISIFTTLLILISCNNDWEGEQYFQYASIKAPMSDGNVTRIRLKYRKDSISTYKLPIIISGSTINQNDLDIHIGLDPDTLATYNKEHYSDRTDLYYQQIQPEHYTIPDSVVHISAGECSGLMDINFNFKNLDLSNNWVLPLIVKDDPSYGYQSHPRKNYNNALLWITPFNNYSGTYGTTALSIYTENSDVPVVVNTREAYVVDEKTIFFYAGAVKENRKDRKKLKIFATFKAQTDSTGVVQLTAENPELKLSVSEEPTYEIVKMMDTTRPNLLRRTVIIRLKYTFEDPYEVPGYIMKYHVSGSMSMQRNINTSIPDEEFAIEW